MKVVGEKAVNPFLADLDKLKLDKVRQQRQQRQQQHHTWLPVLCCTASKLCRCHRLKSVQTRSSFPEGRSRLLQVEVGTRSWLPKLLPLLLKLHPNPLSHPRSPRVLPAR